MALAMTMQTEALSRVDRQRRHHTTHVDASTVRALSATAILIYRYTRESVVWLSVTGSSKAGPRSISVRLSDDTVISTVIAQVGRLLRATPDPPVFPIPGEVRVTWSERSVDGVAPEGPFLSLTIDRASLGVRVEQSSHRGLVAGSNPLRQVARHFACVVGAVRETRGSRIADAPMLDAAELHRVTEIWSRGEVRPELAEPGLLHELFEHHASATPDKLAVICGATKVSYGDLNGRAEMVARRLRSLGLGRGSLVAFQLPRSELVYETLLGILKAGAAYVPLDPECPPDRVCQILSDCRAAALLVVGEPADAIATSPFPVVRLDTCPNEPRPELSQAPCPAKPSDVSYVIYTSGSTGTPKGVAIEHRSARHLVRAEQHLFGIRPSDRVFQGFSIAFDAAVEEVWLAFAAGATLVVGTTDVMRSDLARYLTDEKITVFSTVPTLLATLPGELPTVRLLIVGGETCPDDLAKRWSTPTRRMFNTYGPTEATVIATYVELDPHRPVTIGRPIPNYATYILDQAGHPVAMGLSGELFIGGVGLARGYLHNDEQTSARFVPGPSGNGRDPSGRLYRTGDRARFTESGEIEFLGRFDDQVKLRGFRIEPREIETALLDCEGIAQAVAIVREVTPGQKQLVAYVVAHGHAEPSVDGIKKKLRARLPPYMVPAHIVLLDRFPTLTSGKVDKRLLPEPHAPARKALEPAAGRDPLELTIASAWAVLFSVPSVMPHDDFFLDLGGHSLAAAQMVSTLRREPALESLSVLDVYKHSTPSLLARRLRQTSTDAALAHIETPAASADRPAVSTWRFWACGAAQGLALYLVCGLQAMQSLAPYLSFVWMRHAHFNEPRALFASVAVILGTTPIMLLASIAIKWLVIGRYRAGRYPLWSSYYFRWWLVDRVLAVAPLAHLAGTPLLNLYCRLMGARIGKNVLLASESLATFDLLSIGDDSTVGFESTLWGHTVEDGMLILGPIKIGARCAVGGRSVVAAGGTLEDDASLGELSLIAPGATVLANEHWVGSPAARASSTDVAPSFARPSSFARASYAILYSVGVLVLPMFALTAMLPGLLLLDHLRSEGLLALLASPVVALSFVILLCLEIAATKWLVLGKVQPGRFEVFSGLYARKWYFDKVMGLSLDFLGSLYATLYLNPWYRLLGVRLGKNAEVSTASGIVPDLLEIEADAFIADCVSLGAPRIARGYVELDRTKVGTRSFIGNSAVVLPGCSVGEDCLVGCLTGLPPGATPATASSWFGSPAVRLPKRQASTPFPSEATYRPTRNLVAQRAAIELVRVLLPTTTFVVSGSALLGVALRLIDSASIPVFLASFPLLYLCVAVLSALFVIALKWALMGRYLPTEKPLWSRFVWRTELVSAMQENVADAFLNDSLKGTPFLAWFFRAMGTKIGRRVYLGTTHLTEHDLVQIGDGASLNDACTLQTHLFEDRVMKMSTVQVDARCVVGSQAVLLPGARMEQGSVLGELSLLMKGETLPAWSGWVGSPATATIPARQRPCK